MHVSSTRRRLGYLVLLFILGIVPAASFYSDAQASDEQEVLVVEDITVAADCVVTAETYSDADRTKLVDRRSYPCPLGSVLLTQRMSEVQARAKGLRYVESTGNATLDERMLNDLKSEILLSFGIHSPKSSRMGADNQIANGTTMSDCGTIYSYTRYMSYTAEGGRVRTGVRYTDEESGQYGCDNVKVTQAFAYLTEPLDPGKDLYWDEEYAHGIYAGAWDIGCVEFQGSTVNYTYPYDHLGGWLIRGNTWFTDESINDTAYGCEVEGEEYTGMLYLDIY